jgi:uncharacterized protein YndB with AHSA1/START domain
MNDRANDKVLADNELLITRTFDAPVELVFRLWSQREHMMRWLGPAGFQCTSLVMDFRPGGHWRACIESATAGPYWMGGQYRDIDAGRRIVFTFAWDSEAGGTERETIVTVTLTEEGGKAVQRFHQTPFDSVESRDSHVGGWDSCFDKEVAYAEQLAQGAAS